MRLFNRSQLLGPHVEHLSHPDSPLYPTPYPPDQTLPTELSVMPIWMQVTVILIQLFGIPTNVVVFLTIRRIKLGSQLTTKLLLSQCAFDCLTCTCALLKVIKPGRWYTGNRLVDTILCHIWFTYFTYWLCVLLSVSNLVCTAFDRFNAVVLNRTYQDNQRYYLILCYTGIAFYSILLASINPLLLQYQNNQCIASHNRRGNWVDWLIRVDSICWPLFSYLIPCIVLIGMYSKMISVLRKPNLCLPSIKDRGSELTPLGRKTNYRQRHLAKSLTIATLCMQTLFLVTHAFDRVYYFLGINHWIEYQVGSTTHLLGLWLITLNNCFNPTALIFTMKPLRRSLLHCFHRLSVYGEDSDTSSSRMRRSRNLTQLRLVNESAAEFRVDPAVLPTTYGSETVSSR